MMRKRPTPQLGGSARRCSFSRTVTCRKKAESELSIDRPVNAPRFDHQLPDELAAGLGRANDGKGRERSRRQRIQ